MELFISAIISLIVQGTKKLAKTREWETILILIILSLIGSVVYISLVDAGMWESVLKIAVGAAGIFALFIKRIK